MDKAIWDRCVAFHGHACPGLALGARLCEFVRERLGLGFSADEELVCIAETDACPVDAVQVLLGCTFGKGNLLCAPTGKSAYTFYSRASGTGVRVVALRRQTSMTREERMHWVLEAPLDELFTTTAPKLPLPEKARIFPTLTCAVCGESMAEPMARIQDGKVVCLHCLRPCDR